MLDVKLYLKWQWLFSMLGNQEDLASMKPAATAVTAVTAVITE
jgi:hypothetical protein